MVNCYSRKIKALILVLAVMVLVRLLLPTEGNDAVSKDVAAVADTREAPEIEKNTAFQNLLQTLASESAAGGTTSETGESRRAADNKSVAAAASTETIISEQNAAATESTTAVSSKELSRETTQAAEAASNTKRAATSELFAAYRLQRQIILEQQEKALSAISSRTVSDSELQLQVQNELLQLARTAAKEQNAENLLRAENGRDTIVYYDYQQNTVTVLLGTAAADADETVLLKELLKTATGVEEQNIKLIM